MALILPEFDDMTSSDKAEKLFKEIIDEETKLNDGRISERGLKYEEEFVKFYLKQERYEVKMLCFYILFY